MAANLETREAAAAGLLSDLSDVWLEDNFSEAFSQPFQDISRIDDAFRFLPAGFSWTGFFYNREIFERYELTPPTNWEEFEHICDTLLTYGETPISLPGQNPFVTALWFDYLNLRLNGTDKKAVMALAHHFIANELSPEFASELDFFQFPRMNPNSPAGKVTSVFGYVIPSGATYPAEASEFVGYMASAEAQTMLLARVGEDPTNVGWGSIASRRRPDFAARDSA